MNRPTLTSRHVTGSLVALLVLPVVSGAVGAQEPAVQGTEGLSASAVRQIETLLAAKAQRTAAQRKLGSQLVQALAGERPMRVPARSTADGAASPVAWEEADASDRVEVDIRVDVTAEVLSRIDSLGGSVVNSVPRYRAIRARLPAAAVERLAEVDAVQFIRIAEEPETWVSPGTWKQNTSEGDVAHQADVARALHSVDGSGIGIGVVSNGINSLARGQASGDLPEWVTVLSGQEGSGDEGTAMLEIVHDLAPGADLYYATAAGGPAQFAANIEALCEAGADVIVDDIYYPSSEPAFQDDMIGQAINAVVADGCFYFAAAGNAGNLNDGTSGTWEGDFVPAGSFGGLGTAHDFGDGGVGNRTEASRLGYYLLHWADSLGASSNDYDLFLVDETGQQVLSSSTNTQDGTQDPIEFIYDPFVGETDGLRLVVVKAADAEERYLRVSAIVGQLSNATAGATWGHSAAANTIGVAAVDAKIAGGPGGAFDGSESVETFSSDGPRRVFFEQDGTPITPGDFSSTGGKVLQKPDLAAADHVRTATPGFLAFKGTSAAAPHAAALAALMLEAAGGPNNMSRAQLLGGMKRAALDIEAAGADRDSGAGIVMAPMAVEAVGVAPSRRNRAPAVVRPFGDIALMPGGSATVDVGPAFADPDGDGLTYGALSSEGLRAAASLRGSTLTVEALVPGRSVIAIRATDPSGLTVMDRFSIAVSVGDEDYDLDGDGLIEIGNLEQLDAMRYDLDADGVVDGAVWRPYYSAFPAGALGMGCPGGVCHGYELTADLDFDTDGSGGPSEGDMFWNDGAGWEPVGVLDEVPFFPVGEPFTTSFYGNGHIISNLFINRPAEIGVGLFGFTWDAAIWQVGLRNVSVTGQDYVGSLGGSLWASSVGGGFATKGFVSGRDRVGGLIGHSASLTSNSYAAVVVAGSGAGIGGLVGVASRIASSYATGRVSGNDGVGGLAGFVSGVIDTSYATGRVTGRGSDGSRSFCGPFGGIGGLVGHSCNATIQRSLATGAVSGRVSAGGLIGSSASGTVRGSYWDLDTSGLRVGVGSNDGDSDGAIDGAEVRALGVTGQTTDALQTSAGSEGLYETWTLGGGGVEGWDLGTAAQYPALGIDLDKDGEATWQELGFQLREGPRLSVVSPRGQGRVDLTWGAVDTSHWTPAPSVTYTITRHDGDSVRTVAEDLTRLEYMDSGLTVGKVYRYQVAAVVQGGEATRSALLSVKAGTANRPPSAVGALPDRTLREGGRAVVVDISAGFRDRDGDVLTYSASSSSTAIVAVSSSGSSLTLEPSAVGNATVAVTATDAGGSGTAVMQRFTVTVIPRTAVDYDRDDDGLIEITSLVQLDAVRHDRDGDGRVDTDNVFGVPADGGAYAAAFPRAAPGMGCSIPGGCKGHELLVDLDLDTNRNGHADATDAYWNDGAGWRPIGAISSPFRGVFEGNGHTISRLFIDRATPYLGLFGYAVRGSVIRHLGVVDFDVRGSDLVGGLVGANQGSIGASYAVGEVSGRRQVGGLVGNNSGTVTRSHSRGRVSGERTVGGLIGYDGGAVSYSYATSRVSGVRAVGGLVGNSDGEVSASYATGRVSGTTEVGGLLGESNWATVTATYATGLVSGSDQVGGLAGAGVTGIITASYATGRVLGSGKTGGLVGHGLAPTGASYWDTSTSGHTSGAVGEGRTTAALQAPTGYGGIFETWNADLNGDGLADDPWQFGTSAQYPVLNADIDGDGRATWQEFGYQLRESPTLKTRVTDDGDVVLAWTAVEASHWNPAPKVTYTLTGWGANHRLLEGGLRGRRYTDKSVPAGRYAYRVAAVVNGGEATRSAAVIVTVPDGIRPPDPDLQPPDPDGEPTPPMAVFTVSEPCADGLCRARTGIRVSFLDTSRGTVTSRRWDLGDGTTSSTSRRPEHAWTSPGFYMVSLTVSGGGTSSTSSVVVLVEASDPAGFCESDAETLCLQDSRFAVAVEWRTDSETGAARVVRAGTNDSGLFRFFDTDNWEVLMKVLDGCALNGHVWVYGASTTDLGYTIRVTDTVTGKVKEYRNQPGLPAPAIADPTAFPQGCRP